ncbi:MAG: carboxymuconolactone decarboxylase family protein [Asgard group archaeon]|nr:carboxymuconolactone decarboxylase family protein [Asgard group archaeon]
MASIRTFNKNSYTLRIFLKDIKQLFRNFSYMKSAFTFERIDRQFAERIMLAVTAVNDCEYCIYGHSGSSIKSGVEDEEVKSILKLEYDKSSINEIIALDFAKQYAKANNKPSKKAYDELVNYYGPEKVNDILVFIRIVSLGNYLGNTIEAYEARKKGFLVENGSIFFETIAYLFAGRFYKHMKNTGEKIIGYRFKI